MYRALFKFKSTSISGSLSPLPDLSSRTETLVVTGHVTPQTLGDKSVLVWGGVSECFDCCCDKSGKFQILGQNGKL